MPSDLVQRAALDYAAMGWPVFAIGADSKQPRKGSKGLHDATTDHEVLQKLFPPGCRFNLGGAVPDGLIALDLDLDPQTGTDGAAALAALDLETPPTAWQRTPRGGRHLVYRLPPGVRGVQSQGRDPGSIAPGVDTRAAGRGYLVLAPSTVGGKAYRWEVEPRGEHVADAPEWLVDWCREREATEAAKANGSGPPKGAGSSWELPESIPAGGRNSTVFRFAAHWRACGYAEDLAYLGMLHLHRVCEQPPGAPFTEAEAEKAFRSAWDRYQPGATPAERHPENVQPDVQPPGNPPGADARTVTSIDFGELVSVELPERDLLLEPFLFAKSLGEHYAARGVGKTHLSLGIAYAVATGGEFLKWKAPRPARVLLVDGEMVAGGQGGLQERMRGLAAGGALPEPGMLRIVSYDLQGEGGIPSLATEAGQAAIEQHLEGVELLILDNLSCLFDLPENDADEWKQRAQPWLMSLRRRGVSVLFAHHAGKSGQQRGTGAREDVLDYVLRLKHPPGYDASEGARFVVSFEKSRGVSGRALAPFEARLSTDDDGVAKWTCSDSTTLRRSSAEDLLNAGMSVSAVARELGENKGTVSRWAKALREREGR